MPVALVTVALTDVIPVRTDSVVEDSWKVKGTDTLNWPPNACDAVLWNQLVADPLKLIVKSDVGISNFGAVLNEIVIEVSERVVV